MGLFKALFGKRPIAKEKAQRLLLLAGAMYVEENNMIASVKKYTLADDEKGIQKELVRGFCSLDMNMHGTRKKVVRDLLLGAWQVGNKEDLVVVLGELLSGTESTVEDNIPATGFAEAIAWDWARYVHVLRLSFLAEYLEPDEAFFRLNHLLKPMTTTFKDWSSFITSYRKGRARWLADGEDGIEQACQRLMSNPLSPYSVLGWFD